MEQLDHKLWDEWTSFPSTNPVEDEIAGIIDGLVYKNEGTCYNFYSTRLFTVRRLMKLWSESQYQTDANEAEAIRLNHLQQKGKISFFINISIAEKVLSHSSKFGRRTRNWNWVRGLWGSCGSLYIPKAGYHLVMRPPTANGSVERLQSILKSAGFSLGIRKKTENKELMLRDQQQIVTFLSRLGFVQSALALEETAIYRSMRSHANKLVNCDAANINKSLNAAQSQLQMIKQLEDLGLVEELPEPLKDLIFARKISPSISLKELGQSLPRPISKSTVEYRWRKLDNLLHRHLMGDGGHVLGKSRC